MHNHTLLDRLPLPSRIFPCSSWYYLLLFRQRGTLDSLDDTGKDSRLLLQFRGRDARSRVINAQETWRPWSFRLGVTVQNNCRHGSKREKPSSTGTGMPSASSLEPTGPDFQLCTCALKIPRTLVGLAKRPWLLYPRVHLNLKSSPG
jgi:hypothetical protein